MPQRIDEKRADEVQKVYSELIGCAARRETISYSALSCRTGVGSTRSIGRTHLDPLYLLCRRKGLPGLTSLVVLESTGWPSGGYPETRETVLAHQEEVHEYDWHNVPLPTTDDLNEF